MKPFLPSVPSCETCNNGDHDELAKEFAILSCSAININMLSSLRKTVCYNRKIKPRYDNASIKWVTGKEGFYEPSYLIDIGKDNLAKIELAYARYIRGIYRFHFKEVVSEKTHTISIGFHHHNKSAVDGKLYLAQQSLKSENEVIIKLRACCERVDILEDVYTCWMSRSDDINKAVIIDYRRGFGFGGLSICGIITNKV